MAKKFGVLLIGLFSLLLTLSIISAALEITQQPVSVLAIPELNKPAMFSLNIKNLGGSEGFTLYSLASVNIEPNDSVFIDSGATQNVLMKVYPTFPLKVSPDYYSFEYKIKGASIQQSEEVAITLVAPKDAFDISFEDVNPASTSTILHFKNKYGGDFEKIYLELSSPMFSATQEFALVANEDKQIQIPLDSDKVKTLTAGEYIVDAKIKVDNIIANKKSVINFNEKAGITVTESSEGKILRRYEIEKKNTGNTKTEVSTSITRNLFTSLFTSFNLIPIKKELNGLRVTYLFKKELLPNESLRVVAKTNWWILIGIIVLIFVIYYLIDKYISNKIVLDKRVSFVRTKGGEFALKVTIKVRARDFVERIKVVDRLPPMVKVFERYGMAMPEKIDVANRRLEWNIQALSSGEERIVSYIIYSKIGVVGRFELPSAESIYEYKGKIKEAQSNRAFYLNEPNERKE
jgi:hypothetical protein